MFHQRLKTQSVPKYSESMSVEPTNREQAHGQLTVLEEAFIMDTSDPSENRTVGLPHTPEQNKRTAAKTKALAVAAEVTHSSPPPAAAGVAPLAGTPASAKYEDRKNSSRMPSSVSTSIPGISNVWDHFQRLDRDRTGILELQALRQLMQVLEINLTRRELKQAFKEMQILVIDNATGPGPIDGESGHADVVNGRFDADASDSDKILVTRDGVSFAGFAQWYSRFQAGKRRDIRRTIVELFSKFDTRKLGIISKEGFLQLVNAVAADKSLPPILTGQDAASETPALIAGSEASVCSDTKHLAENAWATVKKVPFLSEMRDKRRVAEMMATEERGLSVGCDRQKCDELLGVNFPSFEAWWKHATGMNDADIPVLPEFMVLKINDQIRASKQWNQLLAGKDKAGSTNVSSKKQRSKHWTLLAEKLMALVRMRGKWGNLHSIYETRSQSLFEQQPLPPCIRDPQSTSSAVWDCVSAFFLLYICFVTPVRACFGDEVELWGFPFLLDAFIDIFFIVDIILNCRTSFYDKNGFRENRPGRIFMAYAKDWFVIDVLSCLPVGYIQYFQGTEGSNNMRTLKALRLAKLAKMLRIARLKRIIAERTDNNSDFQTALGILATLCVIIFMAHMLACFFYFVGETTETLGNGLVVPGWVTTQAEWRTMNGTLADVSECVSLSPDLDCRIATSTRYVTAMYYVLNALETGNTTAERGYGIFAEFIRDVILGLVSTARLPSCCPR